MSSYSSGTSYKRRPLYPGAPKNSGGVVRGIATKYSGQKEIKSRRDPNARKAVDYSKRDFENYEEDKTRDASDKLWNSPVSSLTTEEIEEMQIKIQLLERENKEKDQVISRLKAENGRLRATNNVLQGKVKRKVNEEVKERKNTHGPSNRLPKVPLSGPSWSSNSAKKVAGKWF